MAASYDDIVDHPLTQKVADVILRHLIEEYVARHILVVRHIPQSVLEAPVMAESLECPYADLSEHVQLFLHEIEGLCMQYKLTLASSGYDALQVWPWRPGDGLLHFSSIQDCTEAT